MTNIHTPNCTRERRVPGGDIVIWQVEDGAGIDALRVRTDALEGDGDL